MSETMSEWAREHLQRPAQYATLATTNADGAPHQAVIWYAMDGDDIIVNSLRGRAWPTNLIRNDAYSLLVGDDWNWLAARGSATALDDASQAKDDIVAMARVYHAGKPETIERATVNFMQQDRISFRLRVDKITEHRRD